MRIGRMLSPAEIRPARTSDAQSLSILGRMTFLETFSSLFTGHENKLHDYLDRTFDPRKIELSLAKPANRYWLASCGDALKGYAKLKLNSAPSASQHAVGFAQLQKIYVSLDAMATGVGKMLADAIIFDAGAMGVESLWLSVHIGNKRAIRFYQRGGWQPVGKERFSIGGLDLDYQIMALRLAE